MPLAAFYPSDGALFADHPYVILTADWVSQAEHDGAEAFLGFLEAREQQERFQALGYRDRTARPGLEISEANGLIRAYRLRYSRRRATSSSRSALSGRGTASAPAC